MLSLYRRHRPRTFDAVVGQEHIVRTLRNAIELDKVHHAYLFVGSRGTGKTSMAKLLACALNAEGGARADFDPESSSARAILAGTSLDVVEMDAASNNSVDDIRELRENVALAPMQGGKRVYILDEAHMLTTAAWNAFLKTLEEPPQHVVFVLATTEAHKVPPTIIDRCHRFDFQRPSLEQIAGVLRRVAGEEGIQIPDAAVGMLARAATGSFRDALGTLEQLVTYGGNEVKLDDVLEILGVADAELVLAAGEALADRDPRGALLTVQSLSESGRDFTQFMRDLSAHLRHLFVVQTLGHVPDSFSVTAEHTDRLAAQADRLSQGEILRAIDFLAAAIAAVKDGSEPRIQLEMALLKATQPQADLSLQALMFRIDQLEEAVGKSDAVDGSAAAPESPAPAPAAPASAPASAAGASAPASAAGASAPASAAGASAPASAAGASAPASAARASAPASAARASSADSAAPASPAASRASAAAAAAPAPQPRAPKSAPAAAVAPRAESSPQPVGAVEFDQVVALWPAVAQAVAEQNGMLSAALSAATPTALDGDRLTIAFPADAAFVKKKAEQGRDLVANAVRGITGHPLTLDFELSDAVAPPAGPATLDHDQLIERLRAEFGAEEVFDEPDEERD
jgi:DNA polymerase III subunit gamma/tau